MELSSQTITRQLTHARHYIHIAGLHQHHPGPRFCIVLRLKPPVKHHPAYDERHAFANGIYPALSPFRRRRHEWMAVPWLRQ